MWWLIAVIVVIAAFALPRFGKALLAVGALAALGLFVFYQQNEREQRASRKRVSPREVELTDLRLVPRHGSSYRLVGRLRNGSAKFSLKSLQLRITLKDCDAAGQCETIGDTTDYVFASVPPGQTRGLDEFVHFSGMPQLRGRLSWNYDLVEVRAE